MNIELLNERQRKLHARVLDLSRKHRWLEWEIVEALQDIEADRFYRKIGFRSLFEYCTRALGFSESVAYAFISVSRKAADLPSLKAAISSGTLSVPKASRVIPALNQENADELIEYARAHSCREIDAEVARRRPGSKPRERVKPVSDQIVKLELGISKEIYANLLRAQALLSSKLSAAVSLESVLGTVLAEYIERHDPVRKAERAFRRKAKAQTHRSETPVPSNASAQSNLRTPASAEFTTHSQSQPHPRKTRELRPVGVFKRAALTAHQMHAVYARDKGRCTFKDANGDRCNETRWVHIHHIRPVSEGGGNELENLCLLCSYHHDMVHQLTLPIDGQISWLRSRQREYRPA